MIAAAMALSVAAAKRFVMLFRIGLSGIGDLEPCFAFLVPKRDATALFAITILGHFEKVAHRTLGVAAPLVDRPRGSGIIAVFEQEEHGGGVFLDCARAPQICHVQFSPVLPGV